MSTAELSQKTLRQKTIFLNGVEVNAIEPTGNPQRDLAAARRLLAERGVYGSQERITPRSRVLRGRLRRVP